MLHMIRVRSFLDVLSYDMILEICGCHYFLFCYVIIIVTGVSSCRHLQNEYVLVDEAESGRLKASSC